MSQSHKISNLPIKNKSIPIDDDCIFLAHYDISANSIQGHKPLGSYVDDSTILYYDMADLVTNSNGTFVKDQSKYCNSGKLYGPTICNGRNGKALEFDGVDDYVELLQPVEMVAVSMWVDFSNVTSTQYFLGRDGATGGVRYSGTQFLVYGGSGYVQQPINWTKENGFVHFVVNKASETTYDLYVNGVKIGTGTGGSTIQLRYIGKRNDGYEFNGKIDKISIYDRALTDEEITSHYREGLYTIRKDGRYSKCSALEEETINILRNPSFEEGSTYWTTTAGGIIEEGTGYNNLFKNIGKIKTDGVETAHNRIYQSGNLVTEGLEYSFSLKAKFISGSKSLAIILLWSTGLQENKYINSNLIKDKWVNVSMTRLAPIGATKVSCYIYASNGIVTEVHFDEPQLEEKSFATSFVNGSREKGKLYYPIELPADSFTMSFWVNHNWGSAEVPSGTHHMLGDDNNSCPFLIRRWDTSPIRFYTHDGAGVRTYTDLWDIDDTKNKWTFVAVVKEGLTYRIYKDGKLFETHIIGTELEGPRTMPQLGGTSPGNFMYDELRIDKVARSEDEIREWYVSQAPFFPRGNERVIL